MAVDQDATLVRVAVAGEYEVDAVRLEDGQRVLAHVDQAALNVRIVRAFGVRRVMEEGDDPVGRRRREIVFEPGRHRFVDRAVDVVGIEADEVDVGVVERVIRFRARGDAARFAGRRQREHVIVRTGEAAGAGGLAVVISERRPQHPRPQLLGIHIENRRLVLLIGSVGVRVVTEHQPQVGPIASGKARHKCRARRAHPSSRCRNHRGSRCESVPCCRGGGGDEEVVGVAAREGTCAVP